MRDFVLNVSNNRFDVKYSPVIAMIASFIIAFVFYDFGSIKRIFNMIAVIVLLGAFLYFFYLFLYQKTNADSLIESLIAQYPECKDELARAIHENGFLSAYDYWLIRDECEKKQIQINKTNRYNDALKERYPNVFDSHDERKDGNA